MQPHLIFCDVECKYLHRGFQILLYKYLFFIYKLKCINQFLPSDSERSSSEAQSICRFSMSSRGNNPSASKDAGGNPLSLLPPTVGFLIRIGFDETLFSLS